MEQGVVPVAVHLMYPQILNECVLEEREAGFRMGLRILEACDEVWIFGERISEGMWQEWEVAEKLGIPVRMVNSDEIAVFLDRMKSRTCEWNRSQPEMEMNRC